MYSCHLYLLLRCIFLSRHQSGKTQYWNRRFIRLYCYCLHVYVCYSYSMGLWQYTDPGVARGQRRFTLPQIPSNRAITTIYPIWLVHSAACVNHQRNNPRDDDGLLSLAWVNHGLEAEYRLIPVNKTLKLWQLRHWQFENSSLFNKLGQWLLELTALSCS